MGVGGGNADAQQPGWLQLLALYLTLGIINEGDRLPTLLGIALTCISQMNMTSGTDKQPNP
ncbi:hypothetical protein D3C75_1390420 [compost metagenome]